MIKLGKIAKPANPAANKVRVYLDQSPPGYGTTTPKVCVLDENGQVATVGGLTILDYRMIRVTVNTGASGTWTPSVGCRASYVELVGGGGQGGGCATSSSTLSVGGGGGGGAYAASWITGVSATVAWVNGAGGSTGTAGNSGQAGADSTWAATVIVAKGGSGGAVLAAGTTFVAQVGAAGGLAASCTGDLKIDGGIGGDGLRLSGTQGWSGRGGVAAGFGVEAASFVISVSGGTAGNNASAGAYGCGGSGGATLTTAQKGGNGTGGWNRIWEFA